MSDVEGTVLIKRACGHSSPYTFKKHERYGRQRLESFLAKKCPDCTRAAIAALEAAQKAESQRRKSQQRQQAS
jgi:phage FluMu protein Com